MSRQGGMAIFAFIKTNFGSPALGTFKGNMARNLLGGSFRNTLGQKSNVGL